MDISFGIMTKNNQTNVEIIVRSILEQEISKFEVIIIGCIDDVWHLENIKIINDSVTNEKNHITRKKNMIIDESKYETIVMMKDYLRLDDNWYNGMKNLKFDILMNQIVNCRNQRYLDWIWENPIVGNGRNISYDVTNHQKMFAPGAFVIAKSYVFKKYRFNERMVGLGKSSDVQWSFAAMKEFQYTMNCNSRCRLIDRHNRFPKFRRMCLCMKCKI